LPRRNPSFRICNIREHFTPYCPKSHYQYYQEEEISSIASGAVESTVKQIDRRLKISGAQWKAENVPQVLKHRCAYLNDCLL
jgi:hypothetical protein